MRALPKVDFPAPLGPMSTWVSPLRRDRWTPWRISAPSTLTRKSWTFNSSSAMTTSITARRRVIVRWNLCASPEFCSGSGTCQNSHRFTMNSGPLYRARPPIASPFSFFPGNLLEHTEQGKISLFVPSSSAFPKTLLHPDAVSGTIAPACLNDESKKLGELPPRRQARR